MSSAQLCRSGFWDLWWRWTLASGVGAVVATGLYVLLPNGITHPVIEAGETYAVLVATWHYLPINGATYGALSIAQWSMLRRYTPDAWRWVVATGSTALLYPATLWVFETVGLRGFAQLVWTAGIDVEWGIGGHVFALVSQWLVLRRWTRFAWLWPLSTPLIGTLAFFGVLAALPSRVELWPGTSHYNIVERILMYTLFYTLSGLLIALLLGKRRVPGSLTGSLPTWQEPST